MTSFSPSDFTPASTFDLDQMRLTSLVAQTTNSTRMPMLVPLRFERAVVVPTLNERDNIASLLESITAIDDELHVIVVDDGSADGTPEYVREISTNGDGQYLDAGGQNRVHLVERGRKMGYASAVQNGMRYAIEHGAELILQMDADFSHHPRYLPQILAKSQDCDLVVGSRYIRGGGTKHWGLERKILSGGANKLARTLLGLKTRDCTGGFRCWKRELIERAGILDVQVEGYAFLFLTLDRCRKVDAKIGEVPIIFADRTAGESKMSRSIVLEAVKVLGSLWLQRLSLKRTAKSDIGP